MKLQTVELTAFRNFESLTMNFEEINHYIADNGWGKSNVVDAIMWCLTGKLADGSSDIASIKNKRSLRSEVRVNLIFDEIKLTKTYREKWTKVRGTIREEMAGHEQQYFIDDVEMTKQAYENQLSIKLGYTIEWLPIMMNPMYFGSILEWSKRRAIINEMVGDIKPEEVFFRNDLLKQVSELVNKNPKVDLIQKALKKKLNETKTEETKLQLRLEEYQASLVGYDVSNTEKLEEKYQSLDKQIIELKAQLFVFDRQLKEKSEIEKELDNLRKELSFKKTMQFNQTEPLKVACKKCGTLIDEESYTKSLREWQTNRDNFIKSKQSLIDEIIIKGKQTKEKLEHGYQDTSSKEELETKIKELEDVKSKLYLDLQTVNNQKLTAVKLKEVVDLLVSVRRELANIEKYIDLMQLYVEIYLSILNERIDAIFNGVKFKLVEQNIKEGSWEETCDIMDGLVPFNRTNHAQQIKLGIKVIEALKNHKAFNSMPILIDNAEAVVNRDWETTSQVIAFIAGKGD